MSPISARSVAAIDGPTPGIVWSRRAVSPSRSPATRGRRPDLALEQVVLVEQQADLEGDLGVELGHRDRVGRGGLEPLSLRLAQPSVARAGVRVGQRRSSAAGSPPSRSGAMRRTSRAVRQVGSSNSSPSSGKPSSTRRTRRWQTLACSATRVIAKRAAWRSSTPGQRVAGRWCVAHAHLGEAPGIGRVGLRASQPALGKVLRRERVDHRDRDPRRRDALRAGSSSGPTTPSSPGSPVRLPLEPGVERGEARPALAHPQHLAIRPRLAVPATGRDMASVRRCRSRPSPPGQPPSPTPRVPVAPLDVS